MTGTLSVFDTVPPLAVGRVNGCQSLRYGQSLQGQTGIRRRKDQSLVHLKHRIGIYWLKSLRHKSGHVGWGVTKIGTGILEVL